MPQAQPKPTENPLNIRHCRAGRVSDATLDSVIAAGRKAQEQLGITDAEAQLILLTVPQLCEELRQRRAAMDLISDVTDLDNVRFLPASRG